MLFINKRMSSVMASILYHFPTRKTKMYIIHAPDSSKWKVISNGRVH